MKLIVVSLFDGMSCGRLAFRKTNHEIIRYYSSEIDKYALIVSSDNFPEDDEYRLGDVTNIDTHKLKTEIDKLKEEYIDCKVILIGGSPCQGFSVIGKKMGSRTKEGFEVTSLEQYLSFKEEGVEFDGQSYLFWEYIRIKEEINPDFFFLENVRVSKKWLPMFNDTLGVEPIFINSSVCTPARRPRYYWTNINYSDIEEKDVSIQDILLYREQKTRYQNIPPYVLRNLEREVDDIDESKEVHSLSCNSGFADNQVAITKSPTVRRGGGKIVVKVGENFRTLERIEYERLHGVPDNYTNSVSKSQSKMMIGNGWSVDVIAHFFNCID